ncbi:MAG: hypothetical protein IT529_12465 [Burkholderiales bacterium]|nr:hypothetical protein [Burkholderiales bacterium]
MTPRRYTRGLLLALALVLAATAAFNALVDPFWYFGAPEYPGFNAAKPRFARLERAVKPQLLARERPQAIILGSSLAEIGFDATHPALTAGGRLTAYNYAFAGAGWELVQCQFAQALAATSVQRAVIGIHPGALPAARDCAAWRAEVADFSPVKLLFSLQVLGHSLRTVLEQGNARSSHTREGRYLYARGVAGVEARFREFLERRARADPRCTAARVPRVPPPARVLAPGAIAPARGLDLAGLREVIRAARAREVELRLVAYPQHALFLELDLLCGYTASRWAALAAIAAVVAEEAPRGGVELWDFYAYNDTTGEPVAGADPVNWQDPEHFNHEVGAAMLAEMFSGGAAGRLGRRIDPGSVAGAYQAFLEGRERFLAARPRFYDELRAVLPSAR